METLTIPDFLRNQRNLADERGLLLKRDRQWHEYPVGTKAYSYNGGAWLRTERGWTWNGHTQFPGDTFRTPGADAIGRCIELPPNAEVSHDDDKQESADKSVARPTGLA